MRPSYRSLLVSVIVAAAAVLPVTIASADTSMACYDTAGAVVAADSDEVEYCMAMSATSTDAVDAVVAEVAPVSVAAPVPVVAAVPVAAPVAVAVPTAPAPVRGAVIWMSSWR